MNEHETSLRVITLFGAVFMVLFLVALNVADNQIKDLNKRLEKVELEIIVLRGK